MNLTEKDVSSIDEIGTLSGNKVKLLRTTGGFFIAIGRKRGSPSEEALGAGSHPAIVKYNLEKQYPEFQPSMMKSEGHIEPIVEQHSHFLGDDLRKSGHEIYSVQTGTEVEFHITKDKTAIATTNGLMGNSHLLINELNIPKEFAKAMAGATTEKALSSNVGLKLRSDDVLH
jgi:hypothetical protein